MAQDNNNTNLLEEEPALEVTEAFPPTAERMLERLHQIDLDSFDIKTETDVLKGTHAWIFILTMPISALALVVFTLLGSFLTGYFIASFLATALIIFTIAQIIDTYEQKFRRQARLNVMKRIEETEDEIGLLPHFRDFLPQKYRHLWQSVRRKNFIYIDQYISAIKLLQQKLDEEKFIHIWHLKYPTTDPEYMTPEDLLQNQ